MVGGGERYYKFGGNCRGEQSWFGENRGCYRWVGVDGRDGKGLKALCWAGGGDRAGRTSSRMDVSGGHGKQMGTLKNLNSDWNG